MIALLCCAALLAAAPAQDAPPYEMPEDLLEFWLPYWEAKQQDDEAAMDGVARLRPRDGEAVLDILIDDISRMERYELHDELRTLAWCLDRAGRTQRFISRVRYVFDLDLRERRARSQAIRNFNDSLDLRDRAREADTEGDYERAIASLRHAFDGLQDVGDHEFSLFTAWELADLERMRGREGDQARYLTSVVELGEKLEFPEPLRDEARSVLLALEDRGVVPGDSGPSLGGARPVPSGGGDPERPGAGLSDYATGSAEEVYALELVVPKKGITGVKLPSFHPPEQYYLWHHTWLEGNGPSDFINQQGGTFRPGGRVWKLVREGVEFGLDVEDDGEVDVWFAPNSSPRRVDVPVGEDGQVYPLMMAIMSEREPVFGMELNYSPQENGARLRFGLAAGMEGEVQGKDWVVYDANLSGSYGDFWSFPNDLITIYSEQDHVSWWEPDAVKIGKAKKAVPWSKVLSLPDGFFRATIDPDGSRLVLRKMNLKTGFVKLDMNLATAPSSLLIRESGRLENSFFDVLPAKKGGAVEVPVGSYELVMGRIVSGKKTSMDQVRVYTGTSQPFEVKAGETHTLTLGAPFRLQFQTRVEGSEAVLDARSIRVFGRGGEEYASLFDEALLPLLEIRTTSGKKVRKAKKMRQCGIEDWSNNQGRDNIQWFPLEHREEIPKGETLQFRMTQKKHRLLGGPFESAWTP